MTNAPLGHMMTACERDILTQNAVVCAYTSAKTFDRPFHILPSTTSNIGEYSMFSTYDSVLFFKATSKNNIQALIMPYNYSPNDR